MVAVSTSPKAFPSSAEPTSEAKTILVRYQRLFGDRDGWTLLVWVTASPERKLRIPKKHNAKLSDCIDCFEIPSSLVSLSTIGTIGRTGKEEIDTLNTKKLTSHMLCGLFVGFQKKILGCSSFVGGLGLGSSDRADDAS